MEGGVGDRWEGNGDVRLVRWEYIVANVILGTEPNAPLAYTPGLELHHPIMSILGCHGGRLERERVCVCVQFGFKSPENYL